MAFRPDHPGPTSPRRAETSVMFPGMVLIRTAGASILVACLGCGSPHATSAEPVASTPDKLVLHPAIKLGDAFVYHVAMDIESTVTADATPQHAHATMTLDDRVQATGPAELRETFANVAVAGEGEIGDALRRVATALPLASAMTRFDANWQVVSTSIEGTQDDEVRTMIMNMVPVVSFRMLPRGPVGVGESWTNQWNEALRSESGAGTGKVATSVRYTLREVTACGERRCAAIVCDGEDAIVPQNGTTGTSAFHAEQQVDVADVVPVSKTIESKTMLHGEQQGQPFDYKNVVTVRVERRDVSAP